MQDDNDQAKMFLHLDCLDVLEARLTHVGCGDDRGCLNPTGKRDRCQLKPFLTDESDLVELVAQRDPFGSRELAFRHQALHEIPVAGFGRYASSRGVRLANVSACLKFGQLIADRGGTDTESVLADKGLRRDWRRMANVLVDDRLQDARLAFRQHVVRSVPSLHDIHPHQRSPSTRDWCRQSS